MGAKLNMADDGVALTLIQQTHDATMDIAKSIHGNGGEGILTRLSHVERSVKELAPDSKSDSKTRWRALTEIAIAATAIASLVMSIFS